MKWIFVKHEFCLVIMDLNIIKHTQRSITQRNENVGP